MKVGDINCKVWDVSCDDGSNGRVGEIYMIIGRDISEILEILMVRLGGY